MLERIECFDNYVTVLTIPEKHVTSTRGNLIHIAEIVRDTSKILIMKR